MKAIFINLRQVKKFIRNFEIMQNPIVNQFNKKLISFGIICLLSLFLSDSLFALDRSSNLKSSITNENIKNSVDSSSIKIDTLLLPKIRATIHKELQGTNNLLQEINSKVSPTSFISKFSGDLPHKLIWEFLFKPLFLWLLGLLGSLSIISKITVHFRLRSARKEGRTAPKEERANSIINIISYSLFAFIIIYLIVLASFIQPSLQVTHDSNLEIADKLSHIEKMISSLQSGSERPLINFNAFLFLVTCGSLMSFIILLIKRSRESENISTITDFSNFPFEAINTNRNLLVPIILVLFTLLLPYPVDSIILPFILSFFILAFLDLLNIYPNPIILKIFIKHYSLLIYLAYYGIWSNFFYAIKYLLQPIWSAYNIAINESHNNYWSYVNYFWQWFPVVLAIFLSFPYWLKLRKTIKNKKIGILNKLLSSKGDTKSDND